MTPEELIAAMEKNVRRVLAKIADIDERLKAVEKWIDYEQQCREDDE